MAERVIDLRKMTIFTEQCLLQSIDSRVVAYTQQLIQFESITPNDMGCQTWIANKLKQLGAEIEHFECNEVSSLIATIDLGEGPDIAFCGHTDVVPIGHESKWDAPPFAGEIIDQHLIGRGVADMKGGIAAALVAVEEIIKQGTCAGKIWFLITSDEEGEAEFGTKHIVNTLSQRDQQFDFCIVGEPTSDKVCGDTIKVGRRGALSFDVVINGKSGHVAYPEQGVNAIHLAGEIVQNLTQYDWQQGESRRPSTTLQITHIDSGKWSDNVIPDQVKLSFNVRFTEQFDEQSLIKVVDNIVRKSTLDYTCKAYRGCVPYYCDEPTRSELSFVNICQQAIAQCIGEIPRISTSGGTSDGRFVRDICNQVIELGLTNSTIHQENERIHVNELSTLSIVYFTIFRNVLGM